MSHSSTQDGRRNSTHPGHRPSTSTEDGRRSSTYQVHRPSTSGSSQERRQTISGSSQGHRQSVVEHRKSVKGPLPGISYEWLGAQPTFTELKLKTDSHDNAEINLKYENGVKIKLKTGIPVKVATKFTQVSNDKDLKDFVFTQRKDKEAVSFYIGFPDNGYYKFEIFATEEHSASDAVPNVYNYLIHVKDIPKPAIHLAKAHHKFYTDYCALHEPRALNKHSHGLDNLKFKLDVPGAHKVAVHCKMSDPPLEEWFHLELKGGSWQGKFDISKYQGKKSKVTVDANYDMHKDIAYLCLLEYFI